MNLPPVKGKKITLVGGAGFIGHNLALKLKELGAEVSIIDGLQVNNFLYLSQTNQHILNREMYLKMLTERMDLMRKHDIPVFVEDARNYHKLSKAITDSGAEIVVLLAAVSHANRSNKDPYNTFDHSLRTLENALDASKNRIEHFVYFSSSMVYGDFDGGMVTEESICNPKGIYGALKYGGEKLVIAYNQVFDLPYTIIRPSALYGERCISRRVAQIFLENALKGDEININGDGSDRLDFTYIQDLVQGVVRVLGHENARNEIFNLTHGASRSLAELVTVIEKEFPGMNVNYLPKDVLMPDRGTLSVEKAKRLIGYDPSFPIEKGIIEYANWYKENYK